MSVSTVLRGRALNCVPGQGERRVDLAPDLEVPGREVCVRDGAVVEDRELVGLVLAGRDAPRDGGVLLLGAEESFEHGWAWSSRRWAADEILSQARDGPVTGCGPCCGTLRAMPPPEPTCQPAAHHRDARLQRRPDARADVRRHPARPRRQDHPRRRRVARRDGRDRPSSSGSTSSSTARTAATAATRRRATTRPSRPAPTSS